MSNAGWIGYAGGRAALLLAAAALAAGSARAQALELTPAERAAAVEGVARQVEESYVFQNVGRRMAEDLRRRAAGGEYEQAGGPRLAHLLTEHLRAIGSDLHLAVHFSPEPLPAGPAPGGAPDAAQAAAFRADLARDNYGFRKLEILPGNVGYIRLDLFAPPEYAAETYAAAMAFVAETDALIIDLRQNGGSLSPDAIPMLAAYFFERPTHLIDLQWNGDPAPRQLWTWGHVPGKRYLEKPVYVLTSRRTFSGAEEFAYDLKNLGRATIVGDTTGGGANPGGTRRASDHFEVFVPVGRVTSPVTGTNWEGVGVVPDIAVSPAKALLAARLEAVRTLAASAADERRRGALAAAEAEVVRELSRFREVTFRLQGYEGAEAVFLTGEFNGWSPSATPLEKSGGGWSVQVEMGMGPQPYKLVVDGEWILDPGNPLTQPDGEFINSLRMVE